MEVIVLSAGGRHKVLQKSQPLARYLFHRSSIGAPRLHRESQSSREELASLFPAPRLKAGGLWQVARAATAFSKHSPRMSSARACLANTKFTGATSGASF